MKARLTAIVVAFLVCASTLSVAAAPGAVPGWARVNAPGFGSADNFAISSLAGFGSDLYAGTYNEVSGAQVWRMVHGAWSKATVDGFGSPENLATDHLLVFRSQLYASTINEAEGGGIWRTSNGTNWSRVASGGFGDQTNSEVFRLGVFNSRIYATTWSYTAAHGAEIWRSSTGNIGEWSRVVVNGFNDAHNSVVLALETYNNYLYAGTWSSFAVGSVFTTTGGEVWRSSTGDSGTWRQVNADGFGTINNSAVSALAAFNGYLYASTLRANSTGAEVWRCRTCEGQDWTKVVDNGFGEPANRNTNSLEVFQGRLFFAVANRGGGMQVWSTADGTHWDRIASGGFDSTANYSPYFDNSMAVSGNALYVGTGHIAVGGEVWVHLPYSAFLPVVRRR